MNLSSSNIIVTNQVHPTAVITKLETATFGAGCFWCVEAIFGQLKGVREITSGYSGGKTENPTYIDVCSGTTGHAEVIQIIYNPEEISYKELLEVFWQIHDPTTLNKQGADLGTQYRSVIFYHNEEQRKLAEENKYRLNVSGVFAAPIITEIVPFTKFYKAEDYHQKFYGSNIQLKYCTLVIEPKLNRFKKVFRNKLKVE